MSRYIDAEALDALLREAHFEYKNKEKKAKSDIEAKAAFETTYGITVCRMALLNTPTADVQEVKHGRWVNDTYCSICGRFPVDTSENISNRRLTKFFDWCPHCGAKMDGGVDNAEVH